MSGPPRVSVVVPSYRRPQHLARCLAGLEAQTCPPAQLVVSIAFGDEASQEVLSAHRDRRLVYVQVDQPGVLAAITTCLRRADGDIVAFTDDDAVPHPDWLARLLAHFRDPTVGGVGGRDIWTAERSTERLTSDVGRVSRWGKLIGNHHLGFGPPRDVTVLKGCNSAFRREALAIPRTLRGPGAQPHHEVATGLWARRGGWRLIYDPAARVDHVRAPRFDAQPRGDPGSRAVRDRSYNLVACLLAGRPGLLGRRAVFGLVVGDRESPGLLRAGAAIVRREPDVRRALLPSLAGQAAGIRDHLLGRGPTMATWDDLAGGRARPRVALVAHDIHDRGGMERVFAELIRRAHRRVDFVVVSGTLDADLRRLVEWRPVRVPQRPFPLKFVAFFLAAAGVVRRARADLVETMGAIIPNHADIAAVHFCHAGFRSAAGRLAPLDAPPARRLNTAVSRAFAIAAERWSYRPARARALAPVSGGLADELARHYPHRRIVLTPNGVDLQRFRPDPISRRDLRRANGVADDRQIALFVGGDWDRKGLTVAIRGLGHAHADDPRAGGVLWVVGAGNEHRLKGLATACGVERAVRFLGPRTDVERFYSAADVFLLPTLYETFSLVAYEAAASALPLIATRVSGIDELIGSDEAGIIVARTPEAVGDALLRLARDPAGRARMGGVARGRAMRFTWERSITSKLELYGTLLAERES